MNKKLIALASAAILALPLATFAVSTVALPNAVTTLTIPGLIDLIFGFIWPIIAIVVVVFFIVAGFQFITANGESGKIETARQSVIWAFAGVAILMLSFSIPFIIKNTLEIYSNACLPLAFFCII